MIDSLAAHSFVGSVILYISVTQHNRLSGTFRVLLGFGVVAVLLSLEVRRTRTTFYDVLGISINSSKSQIQSAYRRKSKAYHPDKNPDVPDAEKIFYDLKQAYDVLFHDVYRSNYNRFGDYMSSDNHKDIDDKMVGMVLALAVVIQGLSYIIGYFCTFHRRLRMARQFFIVYNVAVFCLELHMRFVDDDAYSFIPLFGALVPFERIQVLRRLFPSILCICMIISDYCFTDNQAVTEYLLNAVLSSNRVLCERLGMLFAKIHQTGTLVAGKNAAPSTAGIKLTSPDSLGSSNNTYPKSAAVKAKLAGLKVAKTNLEENETLADVVSPNDPWEKFASSLTEEQVEQLTKYMSKQGSKSNQRSSINWTQVLIWGGLIIYWIFSRS